MEQIKVVLEEVEEEKSTEEIIEFAVKKAHKSPSTKEWENFINEYVYLGNGHLLVIEALIEEGFKKAADNYFKALINLWKKDYESIDELLDEVFVPFAVGMESFERNISFKEWIKENKLPLKDIK